MKGAAALAARVQALQARFEHIAATRMAGLPLNHPGLAVEAVGFAPEAGSGGALGVLVTPWFMNLVWLPLDGDAPALAVGASRPRRIGGHGFEFLGADEPGFGGYEACSLFSPMSEFADQAAARATAQAVLALLREPVAEAVPAPARRGFLFGRSAT